jgi:hypothetical protein
MSKMPTTLLEQPVEIDGNKFGIAARTPENLLKFANYWLKRRGILTENKMRHVMQNAKDDPVAHDAAWLRVHSLIGLKIIGEMPKDLRVKIRKLWANAFYAGAHHESITVNLRYLPDVQAHHKRKNDLPAKARAGRKPKLTLEAYRAAKKIARTRKEFFSRLGVTGPAVLKFEKRYPGLRKK